MGLKDWMNQVEASKLNETATLGLQGTTTSTATAPKMDQKVMVKPGQPPKTAQPDATGQTTAPPATMTTQSGKVVAHGDAAQIKKLGDLVNTGGITMTDPMTGKPIDEEKVMEVAPPGMEDVVLALKKKFPGNPEKAFAIAWHNYNKTHGKKSKTESVAEGKEMSSTQLNEGTLAEILASFPHEHKQCQEGWGMDESLYEALCDHYYREGRIPRKVWHGPLEELRSYIEEAYMEDTKPVEEGWKGAVAGGLAGAALGSMAPGFGTLAGGLAGAYAGHKLGDEGFKDPDAAYKKAQAEKQQSKEATPEGLGGALAGGTIGAALGGPVGALRGATLGSQAQDMFDEEVTEAGPHDADFVEKTSRHERLRDLAKRMGDREKFDFHNAELEKLYGTKAPPHAGNTFDEEVAEGSKEDFRMDARRADPRIDKYATDPKPSKLSQALGKVGSAVKAAGSKVMDKLHPSDEELRSGPLGEESDLERDVRDSAMRNLKDEMDENMYESKKPSAGLSKSEKSEVVKKAKAGGDIGKPGKGFEKVEKAAAKGGAKDPKAVAAAAMWKNIKREDIEEATQVTKTGKVHKADAGGYGRKDDEDSEGKKVASTVKRGRGRPKKGGDEAGEVKKYDFSAFGVKSGKDVKLPKWDKKKTTTHKIATKADREEVDESAKADPMMEGWEAQLSQLLAEGKAPVAEGKSISVSMGQEGGQDSVTISATDEDAQELLKMLKMSGVGGIPGDTQNTLSLSPAAGGTVIDVQPATQDEVISNLANAESDTDADDAMSFIKKMLGHQSTEHTHDSEEMVDEVSHGEYIKQQDDKAEAAGKDKFKAFGQEFDTDEVKEEEENGDNAEEQEEMASDATRDAALAQAYAADQNTNKDINVAEEKEESDICEECGHDECECEHDEKVEESVQLDEWANKPQSSSKDESFETDIDFMTKFISGGLNNIKRDQTTVPSARVVTKQESADADTSMAEQIRKLAGIN